MEYTLEWKRFKRISNQILKCSYKINNSYCFTSQDGKIKLWDMQDYKFITELKTPTPSKREVLGLGYNQDYGSNLISSGFKTFINVYCPEVSITKAYIEGLEGHSSLVVTCKFIPQSSNCVSIDDHTNIRTWDIRQMSSDQIIPNDLVTDLCIITRTDRFIYSECCLNEQQFDIASAQ